MSNKNIPKPTDADSFFKGYRAATEDITYNFCKRFSDLKGETLHEWYLEITKVLSPDSYNEKAQKAFNELTKEQQQIDNFIVDKIREYLLK